MVKTQKQASGVTRLQRLYTVIRDSSGKVRFDQTPAVFRRWHTLLYQASDGPNAQWMRQSADFTHAARLLSKPGVQNNLEWNSVMRGILDALEGLIYEARNRKSVASKDDRAQLWLIGMANNRKKMLPLQTAIAQTALALNRAGSTGGASYELLRTAQQIGDLLMELGDQIE